MLRALAKVAAVAEGFKKPLSICGEMAHDPELIPFLLGIGIRRLSIDPQFMPAVHERIANLTINRCVAFAQDLLASDTIKTVRHGLRNPPAPASG